mgnify:CR=1 FL=1
MAKRRKVRRRDFDLINTKEELSPEEPVDTEETPPSAEAVDTEEKAADRGSFAKTVDDILCEGGPNFFVGVYAYLDREPDYTNR